MNVRNSTSGSRVMFWKLGVFTIAILLNTTLTFRLIWGTHSLVSYNELSSQYEYIIQEIQKYDKIIAELSHEIQFLRNDPSYVEKMIRQRLNFVKDDEMLYLFTDKDS